jgi:hypothetical protein
MQKLLFAGVCLFFVGTLNAQAQTAEQIAIVGCVVTGTERGCLIIKDNASNKTYQINAANPKPNPRQGLAVLLHGVVTNKMDTCQQGPVLENITWTYTKMRCTASGPQQRVK